MRNVSSFPFFNISKKQKLHSAFLSCLLVLFVLGADCPPSGNTGSPSSKARSILFSPETKNDPIETHNILGLDTQYWVDANSDGVDDLCDKTTNTDLSSSLSCYINYYGKFSKLFEINVSSAAVLELLQPQFTDVTGDGIPDYCGLYVQLFGANVNYGVRCISIVKNKKGEYDGGAIIEGTLPRGFDSIKSDVYWVDIDGDKRSDYCYAGKFAPGHEEASCQISKGNKFVPMNTVKVNYTSEIARMTFPSWVDIDGDADKDFTWIEETKGRIRILFMKNEGGKFGPQVASDPVDYRLQVYDPSTIRWWTDWNGDGKSDFCFAPDTSTIQCLSSTGNGFASPVKSGSLELGLDISRGWIDADNDGKTDFCRRVISGGGYYYTCTLSLGSSFGGVDEPGSYKSELHTDRELVMGVDIVKNEKWIQPTEEAGYPMHCVTQELPEQTVCLLVRKEGTPLVDDAEECDSSDQTGSRQKRGTGYQKPDCEFTSSAKALLFKTLTKQVWNYLSAYYSKKHDPEVTVTVVDELVYLQDQSLEYKRVNYNNNVRDLSIFGLSELSHGSMVASLISDRVTGAAPGTPMIMRNLLPATSMRQDYSNWISMWIDVLTEEDPIVTIAISFKDPPVAGGNRELQNQYYEKIRLIGQRNKSVLVSAAGNQNKHMDEVCQESISPDCYDPTSFQDRISDPVIRVAALSEGSLGAGQVPQLAHFSNFGAGKVDIAAPGVNILVNRPDLVHVTLGFADRPVQWKIEVEGGTSVSAPLVAATLVQMKKCQPNATAQQLKAALLGNADKIESLKDQVTEGRVLNSVQAISVFCAGRDEL